MPNPLYYQWYLVEPLLKSSLFSKNEYTKEELEIEEKWREDKAKIFELAKQEEVMKMKAFSERYCPANEDELGFVTVEEPKEEVLSPTQIIDDEDAGTINYQHQDSPRN